MHVAVLQLSHIKKNRWPIVGSLLLEGHWNHAKLDEKHLGTGKTLSPVIITMKQARGLEVKATEKREGDRRGRHPYNKRSCLPCEAKDTSAPRLTPTVVRKVRERHLTA